MKKYKVTLAICGNDDGELELARYKVSAESYTEAVEAAKERFIKDSFYDDDYILRHVVSVRVV